jgi:hypothetical protein
MRARDLLVGLMAAHVVGVSGPPVRAEVKPAIRMGQGRHTYEWVSGWLKLPPGMNVGQMHGDVVVDAMDRVYFSVDTGNAIVETDTEGRIARVFGQALGPGVHGMRLVKEPGGREVIWIAHINRHEVLKISLAGEILLTIPFPDRNGMYKEAKEYVPTALDVAPNGDVYVVDGYGRFWLHRFNARGEYVQSWNGAEGAGTFREPHGVGIDLRGSEPRVVVADRRNHRLQRFTLDGKYVDKVEKDLRLPSKVVSRGKDLMVVDLDGRVTVFDESYEVLAQLGDNTNLELRGKYAVAPADWKEGEFIAPHGAAWDSKGNLYVADWNSFGRINKLARSRE